MKLSALAGGSAGALNEDGWPEAVLLRLPPELQSVSRARAGLVELAAQWGCQEDLVEDAEAVLSELMSNGVLHAGTELQVLISPLRGGGLRLEVHDTSSQPVLPPAGLPGTPSTGVPANELREEPPTATGRGLAMVSALSRTWGWSPSIGGGKVVWAELGTGAPEEPPDDGGGAGRPAYQVRPVRLVAVPVRLLKVSEDHFDDLFRELQMARLAPAAAGRADAGAGRHGAELVANELAPAAEQVRSRLARLREPARRAVVDAVQRDERLVDLDLLADAGMPEVFASCDSLLVRAAKAARDGLLLTEPPEREVVAWRRWLRKELEDQISGRPPCACPFPVVPAEGRDGLERAPVAELSGAVAELRANLSRAATRVSPFPAVQPGSAADMWTAKALERLASYLGARRCLVCLLADDNETVTFGASFGFSPVVGEYWRNYSLSADVPGSEAIRTAKPLFFKTFAQLDEQYPIFLSAPSERDASLACLPLVDQGAPCALGCLVIGFAEERNFGPAEASLLGQLARELTKFIAAGRRLEARRLASERRRYLDKVSRAVGAAASSDEVLKELVQAVVAYVADGAAAHTVAENGSVHYVMNRHRDPGREAAGAKLLQKQELSGRHNQILMECARTGEQSVLQFLPDEALALAAQDDDDAKLLRELGIGSVAVVPVRSGGEVAAVITLANAPGRFISEEDLAAVEQLAAAAGAAMERIGPREGM